MNKAYNYAVLYFLLFSLLLVLSGFMLFEHKIGFSSLEILEYYQGSTEKFIMQKSASGILKTALPHILSFGLFAMVLLHFLFFTQLRDKKSIKILICLLFSSAFLEIFSPFFIILGIDFFSILKVSSFIVLELLILYISWLLLGSIIKTTHT